MQTVSEVFEPFLDKYRKFAFNQDFMIYVHQQSYQDLGLSPVIVHGDIKAGNILYSIDEEGEIQNDIGAIIDWYVCLSPSPISTLWRSISRQVLRTGSPAYDLAYFLAHSADGVVRRQAEVFAVEYYHECLVNEFGGDVSKVPYTVSQLKRDYNNVFLTQAFIIPLLAVFMFNGIEGREASQVIKDAYFDFAVLKALHAFEDADRLLQGEMKDVFEKYGY